MMKLALINAEALPKKYSNFILRRIISLLLTFYISYLFVHFVILNLFNIKNTLTIIASVWFGHIALNVITLNVAKNKTFGDLLVSIKYLNIRNNMLQAYLLVMRSILTTTLFYLAIYFNFLTGFAFYAIIFSLIFVLLLNEFKISINDSKISAIDWITGTVAVKIQRKWF